MSVSEEITTPSIVLTLSEHGGIVLAPSEGTDLATANFMLDLAKDAVLMTYQRQVMQSVAQAEATKPTLLVPQGIART
jgi:hypothetical protein